MRLAGSALCTPLSRLNFEDAPAEIFLQPENLRPIGSFKLRGGGTPRAMAGREALPCGVYTASARQHGPGRCLEAKRLDVPCSVVMPE